MRLKTCLNSYGDHITGRLCHKESIAMKSDITSPERSVVILSEVKDPVA